MRLSTKQIAEKFKVTVPGVHYRIENKTIPESMVRKIWSGFKISEEAIRILENRHKPKPMDIDSLVEFAFNNMSGISEQSGIEQNEIYNILIDKLNDKFGYK